MADFKRVVPRSQLSITLKELEDKGAIGIDWTTVGAERVEVTATLPDKQSTAASLLAIVLGIK